MQALKALVRLLLIGVISLVSFFLIFWFLTWISGNNEVGAWVALLLGFLVVPALLLRKWPGQNLSAKCPNGDGLYPECLYVVAVSESGLTCTYPNATVKSVTWAELKEIVVETNDSGPWGEDVWWLLLSATDKIQYPGGATGEQAALAQMQKLRGFNDEQVIRAMSSTSNARFVCWKADEGPQNA